MSTPGTPAPAAPQAPRSRRRLVAALVLIVVALAGLIVVEKLRDRPEAPAAPHEPAQALIVPPTATQGTAAVPPAPPAPPQESTGTTAPPPPPVVVNEKDVAPATGATRPRDAQPAVPASATGYVVQAGMFANAANARTLQKKLTDAGIKARIETRVQLGPFKDRAEAERAMAKLRALGVSPVLVPAR